MTEFDQAREALTDFTRFAVRHHCLDWAAHESAPETLQEASDCFNNTGTLIVSSRHCENTIYPTERDNYLARVWHDYRHITGRHRFDFAGETATCEAQIDDMKLYVDAGYFTQDEFLLASSLLTMEVIGQARHFAMHGAFPENQLEWARGAWFTMHGAD